MKALSKLEPQKGIWQTSVEVPEIGPNDVLIKIKRSSMRLLACPCRTLSSHMPPAQSIVSP